MNIDTLSFTSRDTYIQWRAEWRAAYAKLSQDIRDQRWTAAMAGRITAKSVHNEAYWIATPEVRRAYDNQIKQEVLGDQLERFNSIKFAIVQHMSAKAKAMLEVRKASKVEAQRQYCLLKEALAIG